MHDIDARLQSHGKTNVACGLPPSPDFNEQDFKNRALRQALAFDADEALALAEALEPQLTQEQRVIFDAIVEASTAGLLDERGHAFYVDGPGGSGDKHAN